MTQPPAPGTHVSGTRIPGHPQPGGRGSRRRSGGICAAQPNRTRPNRAQTLGGAVGACRGGRGPGADQGPDLALCEGAGEPVVTAGEAGSDFDLADFELEAETLLHARVRWCAS
jgi:hypothetical protein